MDFPVESYSFLPGSRAILDLSYRSRLRNSNYSMVSNLYLLYLWTLPFEQLTSGSISLCPTSQAPSIKSFSLEVPCFHPKNSHPFSKCWNVHPICNGHASIKAPEQVIGMLYILFIQTTRGRRSL